MTIIGLAAGFAGYLIGHLIGACLDYSITSLSCLISPNFLDWLVHLNFAPYGDEERVKGMRWHAVREEHTKDIEEVRIELEKEGLPIPSLVEFTTRCFLVPTYRVLRDDNSLPCSTPHLSSVLD